MEPKENRLLALALRQLSYRDRSLHEIQDYLGRKLNSDEGQQDIDSVVKQLEDLNLIDDEKFSRQWASSRLRKGKGQIIISKELRYKGVAEDTINITINNIPPKDWLDSARSRLKKKKFDFKQLNGYQQKQKMKQYLYQRGYDSNTINAAIDDE